MAISPTQIEELFTVTVGLGTTETLTVCVPTQPAADVPVTVNTVDVVGLSDTVEVFIDPGIQV